MKAGETVEKAVVREMIEETGLETRVGELVGWAERVGDSFHFVILDFAVTVSGSRDPVAGDDAMDAAWVPLSRLAELDLVEGLEDFLAEHGVTQVD